ncbi:Serine/threonine-protein kinase Nek11 [Phytophthora nicotianae]|uniref:Serine/threonine-protein kinase Nek11 n=1 Tax=Phytophthora nicotianae TaxID=4792 RepID=A0A0W8CVF8_PHYNI|nr:Serine/threonine-protein kinase Nek11 [Phytophthora nicotianae]
MSATSQGSTIKLDLASQFGHEKPEISIHFATLEEAGSFVRSYAFNEGKSVKRNKGTRNYKKWLCTSTAEECPWFVTLSRKRETTSKGSEVVRGRKKKKKLSHVPDNAWYISKLDLQHSQFCNSVVEMTSKYLVEQPGFKAAITEGHSTSMKRVVNNVKTFHGVDMQKQPALVYRAIQSEKEKQKVDPTVEYRRLPSFFQVFERKTLDRVFAVNWTLVGDFLGLSWLLARWC